MSEKNEFHELDDYDRAAIALLIQAVEMQPNAKARELTESVAKLMEFLERRSVVSFLGAQVIFNSLDGNTKANILRDAKRLATQFAANPNVNNSVDKLMTRLRESKKQAAKPGLLGAINRAVPGTDKKRPR